MPSSSSSRNWSYDVFPSFRGEDVRKSFLSHFHKEFQNKSILVFKDNEIERGQSITPELVHAIKESRIAVVVFSENYASSKWCLNELVEILNCKEESGQIVIPIFYDLDPSHLRQLSGKFGEAFEKTCIDQTEEVKNQWKQALKVAADLLGYHLKNSNSEATMIEEISSAIVGKLSLTPSNSIEEFVGIKHHIIEMRSLLKLESKEVRMVGICGMSGIGKTTIARAIFNNISSRFQSSVYIDRAFIYKCKEGSGRPNFYDYNAKLRLKQIFLSEIIGQKNMKNASIEERLKHQKVLIVIDDLDDQVVLNALAGKTQWFGSGSRIIVVTTDKHLLKAHGIDFTYEVGLPSNELALKMFCRAAFEQNSPHDGLMDFASEVVKLAGNLPLGLNILGLSLRGFNKEACLKMLPRLQRSLNGDIGDTLRVSYDVLGSEEDKQIFRYIACLVNHKKERNIKLFLADSELDVDVGLKNLVDKSLIHISYVFRVEVVMHRLLQHMGKEIVCKQSHKPGKREFLVDSEDIRYVLEENTGTHRVLGISFETSRIDEFLVHESAFKRMRNLVFLDIYTMRREEDKHGRLPPKLDKLQLPETFDHLPPKLKYLRWSDYPMRCMPSTFRPEKLVKLKMPNSKLEKLWKGVVSLKCLKAMDLRGSTNLIEIPDLSMATNLEKLNLSYCSRLVELPSSIRNLNELRVLDMSFCTNLETLPTDIDLKSLDELYLRGCSRLKSFPNISTHISDLYLDETAIQEVPWWIENFYRLKEVCMYRCSKLEYVHPNAIDRYPSIIKAYDCESWVEAGYYSSEDDIDYVGKGYHQFSFCYRFNQSSHLDSLKFPSEEVLSYFTHQFTGTSLTNNLPLPHTSLSQTFIRFKVCAVFESMSRYDDCSKTIFVHCRFEGALGDVRGLHCFVIHKEGFLHILNCCVLLDEFGYHPSGNGLDNDQVVMEIKIIVYGDDRGVKLKGWGVQFLDEECKYCAAETKRRRATQMLAEKVPRLCTPVTIQEGDTEEGEAEEGYAEEGETEEGYAEEGYAEEGDVEEGDTEIL